ncbi:glycosyltransferase [Candidatus Falkowbacteria bacterium]|nr:glycosyltransferase [Candidatus Falkowbacteria bacterium]
MKKIASVFTGLAKVDENLVGTAVIYKKIAELLSKKDYKVNLVVPDDKRLIGLGRNIEFFVYNEKNNKKLISNSDIVVFGAHPPIRPMLHAYGRKKRIITYLWSIAPIGSLDFQGHSRGLNEYIVSLYNLTLLLSDKIFCRDETAKKIILGSFASLGRMSVGNYNLDRSFDSLIEEAPFGIEKKIPVHKKNVYRDVLPGVKKDDFLILWNGGLWNRNDGQVLIRAMGLLKKYNKFKLIFQGYKHPDPACKITSEAKKVIGLAKKMGLKDKTVFFIDDWVSHNEKGNYLTECDLGVATCQRVADAMYLLKTRVYDYIWAGMPTVISDCDSLAPLISKNGLGLVCKTGDHKDLAEKIFEIYNNKVLKRKIEKNIYQYRKEINWTKTLEPISRYLEDRSAIKTLSKNLAFTNDLISSFKKIIDKHEKK